MKIFWELSLFKSHDMAYSIKVYDMHFYWQSTELNWLRLPMIGKRLTGSMNQWCSLINPLNIEYWLLCLWCHLEAQSELRGSFLKDCSFVSIQDRQCIFYIVLESELLSKHPWPYLFLMQMNSHLHSGLSNGHVWCLVQENTYLLCSQGKGIEQVKAQWLLHVSSKAVQVLTSSRTRKP